MEKTVISVLKSGSAVIYVLILGLVLSIPVVFIYQAVKPPVFTFESVAIEESFTGDEVITDSPEKWQKLSLSMNANSGSFSPYGFYIEEFAVADDTLTAGAEEIKIILDEPISCSKDITDPFTLTIYIKGEADLQEFTKSIALKAVTYEKSFGEFKLKFVDGKVKLFK